VGDFLKLVIELFYCGGVIGRRIWDLDLKGGEVFWVGF